MASKPPAKKPCFDVVIFYIFVGFLCFFGKKKTYGPTIIILWSEPRIA